MAEHVQSLKVIGLSTVPELDADEVPVVRSGANTDFNGDGRSVIGQALEVWLGLRDLGHVEERDDELVGGLDEHDLEWVTIEGYALQSGVDGVHGGATSDYEEIGQKKVKTAIPPVTDSAHIGVGEDLVLAPVDKFSGLVDVGQRETIDIGLVVCQLSVGVVVDIPLFVKSRSGNEFGRRVMDGAHDVLWCFLNWPW